MDNHNDTIEMLIDPENEKAIGLLDRPAELQFARLASAYSNLKAKHDRLKEAVMVVVCAEMMHSESIWEKIKELEIVLDSCAEEKQ